MDQLPPSSRRGERNAGNFQSSNGFLLSLDILKESLCPSAALIVLRLPAAKRSTFEISRLGDLEQKRTCHSVWS